MEKKIKTTLLVQVVFKYSKLIEEESEMLQHYNKTVFAGLEPNIPNAYCNCMLQVNCSIIVAGQRLSDGAY